MNFFECIIRYAAFVCFVSSFTLLTYVVFNLPNKASFPVVYQREDVPCWTPRISNSREFHLRESQHDNVNVASSTFSSMPIHKDLLEDVTDNKAFFLETGGSTTLNYRQTCSIESLSRLNPNLQVNVFFTGGTLNSSATLHQALLAHYKNVRFIAVDLSKYMAATPLDHWYHHTDWRTGPYHVSHLSDALRFLTLYKYGGYYFDMDIIFVRKVTCYQNFVGTEDGKSISPGAMHIDYEHPVMEQAIKEFPKNYKKKAWSHNGPKLLTRILQSWCNSKDVKSMTFDTCKGFTILSKSSFYPLGYKTWKIYFQDRLANDTARARLITKNLIGVHVWNKLSSAEPVYKNSSQYYTQLAREFCPRVFAIAPDVF